MITERLNSLLKVLIFAFLASGIALALLLQIQNYHRMQIYLATETALPQHRPNGEIRQYKNTTAGYSFQYSSRLSVSYSAGSVELHHQIPYKNSGECNMKGDEVIYDYLTDFRVNIFIAEGNVAQAVKQLSPYMPKENFVNDTLTISPGFIDLYQIGNLKGYSIYEGAEGCGHIIYYFPLSDAKVLVVKRSMVQLLSSAVLPEINQDVLVTPGVINPGQADLIFNQLLKSFQYQPQNALSNSIELDTKSWKTYKNDQYRFSLDYPVYFFNSDKTSIGVLDATQPEDGPGAFWGRVSIDIWQRRFKAKDSYKIGDDCAKINSDGGVDLNEGENSCSVLSLDPYVLLIGLSSVPENFYSLNFINKDFQLILSPLPKNIDKDVLKKIISTFKFTK